MHTFHGKISPSRCIIVVCRLQSLNSCRRAASIYVAIAKSLSARHSFVKCRSHKAKHSITKPKQQPVPCGMISWSHTHPHPFQHSTRSQECSYVSLLPEVKVACLGRTEVSANGGVLGRCGRVLAHGSGNVRSLAA